jgi:hypothetical protein
MNLKEIVRKELLSEQGRKRDVIRRVIKDIVTRLIPLKLMLRSIMTIMQ